MSTSYKYRLSSCFLCFCIAVMLLSSCHMTKHVSKDDAYMAIKAVMKAQEEAWSAGDLHAFMEGYWNNENLSFIGRKGVTRGWQQTLDNYISSYPNKNAMGKLRFDIIEMDLLSSQACYVIGKYTLTRKEDQPSGYFNLIFKKIEGKWLICSDHTSG